MALSGQILSVVDEHSTFRTVVMAEVDGVPVELPPGPYPAVAEMRDLVQAPTVVSLSSFWRYALHGSLTPVGIRGFADEVADWAKAVEARKENTATVEIMVIRKIQ
jgi:hypothetical protein